jgi:hypothetical protein
MPKEHRYPTADGVVIAVFREVGTPAERGPFFVPATYNGEPTSAQELRRLHGALPPAVQEGVVALGVEGTAAASYQELVATVRALEGESVEELC